MKVSNSDRLPRPPGKSVEDKADTAARLMTTVKKHLDNFLSSSNPDDYSEKWHEDFSHRPSWCDAGMCLQQIRRGKAIGNKPALYSRGLMQKMLFFIGTFVQAHALQVFMVLLVAFGVCCVGLQSAHIETDIIKLWVSHGGRLEQEMNFLSRVEREAEAAAARIATTMKPGVMPVTPAVSAPEIPRENGLGGGFQVVIQTPDAVGKNVLNKHDMLKHVQIMNEIANFKVDMFGENWTLADMCFKPPSPPTGQLSSLGDMIGTLLDKIIPCIWITPIDCFWEGSKPLGPYPPISVSGVSEFISSLPSGNVSWKNINPTAVLKEVGSLFDLGSIINIFERAGIGAAYQDRPCIEPLDPECPQTSPNAYDICPALAKFTKWNDARPADKKVVLEEEALPVESTGGGFLDDLFSGKRRKRQAKEEPALSAPIKADTEYYEYDDDSDYYTNAGGKNGTRDEDGAVEEKEDRDDSCLKFGNSLRKWMIDNENLWGEFLAEDERPKYPVYGDILTGGCQGFARDIMSWPEDLIIGGVKRKDGQIVSAEAFQSVFLVSSGHDVFLRWKHPKPDLKANLDLHQWSPEQANQVVQAWQRNFTQFIYKHDWNLADVDNRQVHPLASTSISDMLDEFSQFNVFVIFIGYLLMLIYAGVSLMKLRGCRPAVDSVAGLGFAGVLLVTLASVAGLGFSSWINIHFNAATTQIVPFLSLGLGVDDMFLLVHNYKEIVGIVNHNEIGFLMKETGLSVLLTSINNILAFLAGSVLPIPALRSFCLQTAILLFFNMIAIMTMYPAMMAMDLRRRQRGYIDLCCCVHAPEDEEEVKPPTVHKKKTFSKTATLGQEAPPPYEDLEASADSNSTTSDTNSLSSFSLQGFLVNYYIPFITNVSAKIGVIVFCTVLLGAGIMGLSQIVLGLELSDVLPKGTAPAAFLEAREKYFSFYPMFAVVKGPDVDFPAMQHKIEEYRQELGQSRFVIKVNGQPSEKYWMSMMKTWLNSLQVHYDKAMIAGKIDNVTGAVAKGSKLDDEAAMARRLVCSFGENYNCTGRVGVVRLVDSSDTINNEGFYNYLTAWYNVDNMMYYVSQASFVPTPPAWQMSDEEVVVPPARPFGYSQIPFYLTDLVDTAATVEAIKDIRMRCEKFADAGLPNFPSGLPFTFWEQYLHLTNNLLVAILLITGAVFLVISLLLLNPWTSSIVVLIVLIMVVELAGFMGWAGLKLNPVSAVTIITAVGIGVEFTVHVCLSFLTTLGTRNERVARTLEHMFVPVVHGGLSTLLGIVMLAFSQFEFIVRYFFLVLSMLILLGLINGLALLPVLLSLIGPNCEVTATDGSNRLPPPSPKKRPSKNDPNENSTMTATVTTKVEMTMSNVNGQQNKTFDRNDSLSTINEDQEENNQPTILTTIVSTKVELTPQQQPTALRRLATPPESRRDSSTPQTRWSLPPTPSSMSSLT